MIYGREIWGPKAWSLLHSFSVDEMKKISNTKKHNYYILYTTFIYILPCEICREHYSDIIYNIEPLVEDKISRKYLIKWVFNLHNIVNDLLDKPQYPYKKISKNINNKDIYFILHNIYLNFDYEKMSLYNFDQIYNFFINFCILYPVSSIRKDLKKLVKSKKFKKISSPKEFQEWYKNNTKLIKKIILDDQ
jgi:arsenate reductase-like glutaredoxin family protein